MHFKPTLARRPVSFVAAAIIAPIYLSGVAGFGASFASCLVARRNSWERSGKGNLYATGPANHQRARRGGRLCRDVACERGHLLLLWHGSKLIPSLAQGRSPDRAGCWNSDSRPRYQLPMVRSRHIGVGRSRGEISQNRRSTLRDGGVPARSHRPSWGQNAGGISCAGSGVAFLRAAVAYYAGLSVRIKAVYTDNALAYRGKAFAAACAQLGLSHHYTKPYYTTHPRQGGALHPDLFAGVGIRSRLSPLIAATR